MFLPLAVGKANIVCLIEASGTPCWPFPLSLKIVWVGTPACGNISSSSSISSDIAVLLHQLSLTENLWARLSIPCNFFTSLSVFFVLGFIVLFTPCHRACWQCPRWQANWKSCTWMHFYNQRNLPAALLRPLHRLS